MSPDRGRALEEWVEEARDRADVSIPADDAQIERLQLEFRVVPEEGEAETLRITWGPDGVARRESGPESSYAKQREFVYRFDGQAWRRPLGASDAVELRDDARATFEAELCVLYHLFGRRWEAPPLPEVTLALGPDSSNGPEAQAEYRDGLLHRVLVTDSEGNAVYSAEVGAWNENDRRPDQISCTSRGGQVTLLVLRRRATDAFYEDRFFRPPGHSSTGGADSTPSGPTTLLPRRGRLGPQVVRRRTLDPFQRSPGRATQAAESWSQELLAELAQQDAAQRLRLPLGFQLDRAGRPIAVEAILRGTDPTPKGWTLAPARECVTLATSEPAIPDVILLDQLHDAAPPGTASIIRWIPPSGGGVGQLLLELAD